MQRDEVVARLQAHRSEFAVNFSVRSLSLFGSVARNEATVESDVDILVEFEQPVGLFKFIALQQYLGELLGRKVDLVTPDALKKQLREQILKEAFRAA